MNNHFAKKQFRKMLAVFFLAAGLLFSPKALIPVGAASGQAALQNNSQPKKVVKKSGWVYEKKHWRYYVKGKYVTGLYVTKNQNRFLFDERGYLQTGTRIYKGTTYYLRDNGSVEVYVKGSRYYTGKGVRMTKIQKYNYMTMLRARKLAAQITTSSMTQAQKLEACFKWVISKYYDVHHDGKLVSNWIALHANDHFFYGSGTCASDAAAFAYLAKAIGYPHVYVCIDDKDLWEGHVWCEINGRVYDPLFAEAKNYANNYGSAYATYGLSWVVREELKVY